MNTDYSGGHISLGRHRKLKDSAQKHATRAISPSPNLSLYACSATSQIARFISSLKRHL